MNITLNNVDPVNAVLKMEVVKADYAEEVEKSLKNLRQRATIPGFRAGKVPMSVAQKMYGKSVLIEEINKIVSKNLYDYIRENNLNVLGEPLNKAEKDIDFDNQEDFEFEFDLGLAPDIKVKITKRDKLPYYTIKVEDDLVDKQIDSYKASHGSYTEVKKVEGKDMVKGLFVELDENGQAKENGINIENAVMMPSYMKEETEKKKFIGAKKNSVITFNPFKAYEGSEVELSSLMEIKKEEVKDHAGDFTFGIEEITRYKEAGLNQELFDKVFEAGTVKTEEEFRQKVRETVAAQYTPDSDYKFLIDARKLLIKKAGKVEFPDAFLKRWLVASNEERTPESVELDYPKIIEDLEFHLIKEELIKENDLKVGDRDLMEYARKSVRAQFARYGIPNVPDDILENYSRDMIKKEETVRNLIDKIIEDKFAGWLKESIALEPKELAVDEFEKLFEEKL
ncbi:MAG: trigger factor [Dysgonamonadaceae bacterium]|jgi:trigger factor|nr:trigger factor [Dysgonamonadaceae bacterium]